MILLNHDPLSALVKKGFFMRLCDLVNMACGEWSVHLDDWLAGRLMISQRNYNPHVISLDT